MLHQQPADQGLAVFLPAYNEMHNIEQTIETLVAWLETLRVPYRVIIVNDGSSDLTAMLSNDLADRYAMVEVVHHPVNMGYGTALRTGMQAALETGLPWVGFIDSDGQFDPGTSLAKLWRQVRLLEQDPKETSDVAAVVGYRAERADGSVRLIAGRAWHYLSGMVLRHEALDIDCGCKLFRASALRVVHPRLRGTHAATSPEVMARIFREGWRVYNLPVEHLPRRAGEQTGLRPSVAIRSVIALLRIRLRLQHGRTSAPAPQLATPSPR